MEVARHGKRAAFVGGVDEPIEPFRSVRGDREQAVGNSTSGATTTGVVLLPGLARIVSGLLPPGAAVRAVADLSYFGGAHVAGPLITLALWAVLAALLVGLRSRQVATRG